MTQNVSGKKWDETEQVRMYNIREWLFFVFRSLGLMAAHIRPKIASILRVNIFKFYFLGVGNFGS